VSDLLRALDAPRRRELLRLAWERERSAGELHRELADVTFGAVSQHLRILAEAGLVAVRRDGRLRLYRARKQALGPFRAWLEASWGDALYRLKLAAELEAARRGPRPSARRTNEARSGRTSQTRRRSR
jgi:DNA-binding transcriptional ArsR family regulator